MMIAALMAVPAPAMGEVVISNLSQSSFLGSAFGAGDWVRFDSTQVAGVKNLVVVLRAFNPGNSVTSVSATISAANASGGGSVTSNGVITQVTGTNYFQVDFDVSGLSIGSGTNQFDFTSVTAITSDGGSAYWGATSATNGGFSYASGYSNGATSDDVVGTYGQFAVSVPEPGTLMLGGISAAVGLALGRRRMKHGAVLVHQTVK